MTNFSVDQFRIECFLSDLANQFKTKRVLSFEDWIAEDELDWDAMVYDCYDTVYLEDEDIHCCQIFDYIGILDDNVETVTMSEVICDEQGNYLNIYLVNHEDHEDESDDYIVVEFRDSDIKCVINKNGVFSFTKCPICDHHEHYDE